MKTKWTLLLFVLFAGAMVVGRIGDEHSARAAPAQDAKKSDKAKFQVPKDAIKGAVKAVDLAKNSFTLTLSDKKDRTFAVSKTTEFWGPNGGDRGTGPVGLKDDCMALGYEIQVAPEKDGKTAKDVYLPTPKPPDSKSEPKKDAKADVLSAVEVKRIASKIAAGHSYEKHVVDEKLFPEVKSEKDFVDVIAKVLTNPTHHRELENDREAFYDSKSNTIVIYNPHAQDDGTCFRPRDRLEYYKNLK